MRDKIMVLTTFLLATTIVSEKMPIIKTIDPYIEAFLYGVGGALLVFAALIYLRKAIRKWQDLNREFWMLEGRVNDLESKQKRKERNSL